MTSVYHRPLETRSLSGSQHKANSKVHTHKPVLCMERFSLSVLFPTKHTALKSTQVEVLQQWYAFHWIQFSFNLNTFKLQLKVSTLTSQFHFQTHRAWIQSQNNTKRLTALMLSDCADDVFIEIRQVCDKIFTFFDSSVLQADVMRPPCRQQTELATMWHQGCFDLLLVQFRAPILVDMNLPVQILCSTAWFWVRTELFVDLINLHNNSLM